LQYGWRTYKNRTIGETDMLYTQAEIDGLPSMPRVLQEAVFQAVRKAFAEAACNAANLRIPEVDLIWVLSSIYADHHACDDGRATRLITRDEFCQD
jgi:hypothetical protein